ncbi:glutamyl-tRNA reductase [Tautonia sociabilis]|uniref:Glutamyl-tRNA reductase n=1 Tax=Tautonia sociabilis TaxID=2080755 RepID=A0A432MIV2_9BACT|nr:glutamyl-tRNA reductase [Tautonia sociabilis]RUL87128.1 glutamyl-tRNA reductase [Tautonia sociabilis]
MKLLALGVDHHSAPQPVREAIAFDGSRRREGLEALKGRFPGVEFAILSTCNRVEVYAAGDPSTIPQVGDLTQFLAEFHGVDLGVFATHLVDYHDEEAIEHLFRVASSIESLVIGEGQIQGQVREAYEAAREAEAVGPILHEVFQQSARVGKRVREATGMDRGRLSIASVAVDVARRVFDRFDDKAVLVIGAGKMAELTLRHLAPLRPGRILVTNRSPERAQEAARAWGGRALPFEELESALVEADVVVSTTASAEPIVSFATYSRVLKARRYRHSLILDIAVPRDFDPRINDLETVTLYSVDDLQAQADANRSERLRAVEAASAIVQEETASCADAIRHRHLAGSILRQLGDYSDAVRSRELDRLFASRPHLSEDDRKAIAQTLHRFQNQLLHHPRSALRSATGAADGHGRSLVDAVRHLFGLGQSEARDDR